MGARYLRTTPGARSRAGAAVVLCVLTACLGGARRSQQLRTMGVGPAMRVVVSPLSCYTVGSPAPSTGERKRRVEVEGPVLVLASMHAPDIEAAAKVMEIWGRSGRDAGRVPEIAMLLFREHPWTGALHNR